MYTILFLTQMSLHSHWSSLTSKTTHVHISQTTGKHGIILLNTGTSLAQLFLRIFYLSCHVLSIVIYAFTICNEINPDLNIDAEDPYFKTCRSLDSWMARK